MPNTTIPALIAALASQHRRERTQAARVLVEMGTITVDPLLDVFRQTSHPAHQQAMLATILGRLGNAQAIDPLLTAFSNGGNEATRRAIAENIGHIHHPRVTAALITMLAINGADTVYHAPALKFLQHDLFHRAHYPAQRDTLLATTQDPHARVALLTRINWLEPALATGELLLMLIERETCGHVLDALQNGAPILQNAGAELDAVLAELHAADPARYEAIQATLAQHNL